MVLVLFLLVLPLPAFACTPAPGYRMPTNFELVQHADLVVLARVVDGPDEPFGQRPEVALEPIRALKGSLPADPLRLMGSLKWNGRTVPSMPTPLATSHFSAGLGACIRLFYPKGGLVVAMFQRTEVTEKHALPFSMTPMFLPFARAAEDVESEDGVWVKAVEAYAALQAANDAAHLRAAVTRKQAALAARTDDLAAQAMARDLAFYLDMTGDGKDRHAGDLQWRAFDMPDETAAILASPTRKGAILHCRKDGGRAELFWPEETGATAALRLGEREFAVTPADLTLSPDLKSRTGTIALDGAVRGALLAGTAPAGIARGDATVAAPPRDVLQKFALRCAALLGER